MEQQIQEKTFLINARKLGRLEDFLRTEGRTETEKAIKSIKQLARRDNQIGATPSYLKFERNWDGRIDKHLQTLKNYWSKAITLKKEIEAGEYSELSLKQITRYLGELRENLRNSMENEYVKRSILARMDQNGSGPIELLRLIYYGEMENKGDKGYDLKWQ